MDTMETLPMEPVETEEWILRAPTLTLGESDEPPKVDEPVSKVEIPDPQQKEKPENVEVPEPTPPVEVPATQPRKEDKEEVPEPTQPAAQKVQKER